MSESQRGTRLELFTCVRCGKRPKMEDEDICSLCALATMGGLFFGYETRKAKGDWKPQ